MFKNKWFQCGILIIGLVLGISLSPIKALADDIVVVIDPGHGGENLGADYNGYLEKEMNLIVANAMYEELTKYEGITVYMTRTDDKDMSLLERAEFAKSVDADFLFCLHFNMSVSHKKYGAEVWLSAFGDAYKEAYPFAEIAMQELTGYGLFDRGIKTKLNDKGQDYYGIIRHCTKLEIPSVIIEHAHLDHEKDTAFLKDTNDLVYLGVLDATAVAKYYGLSSKKLDVDYSDYPKSSMETPQTAVKPDSTAPDVVYIEETSVKEENGEVSFTVTAQDYDSPLQYYAFSVDGGETCGELFEWNGEDSIVVSYPRPKYGELELSVLVFNRFDLYSVSNAITLTPCQEAEESDNPGENEGEPDVSGGEDEWISGQDTEVVSKDAIVVKKDTDKNAAFQKGLLTVLCIAVSLLILMIALKAAFFIIHKRNKKR